MLHSYIVGMGTHLSLCYTSYSVTLNVTPSTAMYYVVLHNRTRFKEFHHFVLIILVKKNRSGIILLCCYTAMAYSILVFDRQIVFRECAWAGDRRPIVDVSANVGIILCIVCRIDSCLS